MHAAATKDLILLRLVIEDSIEAEAFSPGLELQ
jgi:hypothetical protein